MRNIMNNFYTKIENLCKQHNINLTKMCKDLKISRSILSDLKAGRQKSISIKYYALIAAYFNIPISVLLDSSDMEIKNPLISSHTNKESLLLSEFEYKLISAYRNKPALQEEIDNLLDIEKYKF